MKAKGFITFGMRNKILVSYIPVSGLPCLSSGQSVKLFAEPLNRISLRPQFRQRWQHNCWNINTIKTTRKSIHALRNDIMTRGANLKEEFLIKTGKSMEQSKTF